MARLGIIGGTGLTAMAGLEIAARTSVATPWGETSAPLTHGRLGGAEILFLPRHGDRHNVPPHKVNYRANLWALRSVGVEQLVAVAAVGGIRADFRPGMIAIPHQIIDYTWGRGHTFFEEKLDDVVHVDFTEPYTAELRTRLIEAAGAAGIEVLDGGTYAATQGPRLESAAEINRIERDGGDMVGMTGMPEAGLARELGLGYAHCALCVNPAAGRGEGEIRMADIEKVIAIGMERVRALLVGLVTTMSQGAAGAV